MKLLKVDTLGEAREKLLAAVPQNFAKRERIDFLQSLGCVLAEDLQSTENIPGFCKSTVDGYAVRASDTQGVTDSIPVFLDVVEEVAMGTAPQKSIKPGQAVYVPTGGMIPEGADAMVMVEYCEKFDERSIAVYEPVSAGRNIIIAGEDITAGQVFLPQGRKLSPREIGVLASAGVHQPLVFKPWRVTVVSTGDELVDAQTVPASGQVRDINTYALSAAAMRQGFAVIRTKVLRDDASLIESAVREAMADSDLVVLSGGSSQGEKDYTADVMDKLAEPGVLTHGIALKPGKPTILGYDEKTETILAGLPGHPAAALLVFELVIGWLFRKLTGQGEPMAVPAQITENVAAAGGKTTCLLVELQQCGKRDCADHASVCNALEARNHTAVPNTPAVQGVAGFQNASANQRVGALHGAAVENVLETQGVAALHNHTAVPNALPSKDSTGICGVASRNASNQRAADLQNGAASRGDLPCVYQAVPIFGKSGLMTTLTRADGYVLIDMDAEGLAAGQQVLVTLF